MTAEKILENRLRRIAKRRGYQIVKSRRRDPRALDFGGYMVIDVETRGAVFGMSPAFSADLDDIEEYFNDEDNGARSRRGEVRPATRSAKGRSRRRSSRGK